MSTVTINNSPVHSDIIVTNPFGVSNPNYTCGWHTGIDFAPYGSTPSNPILYSVCNGEVVETKYDSTLGYQILIKDSNNMYWRYCHMLSATTKHVGDLVTTNSIVGIMGSSGNSTGIHLHLEYASSSTWSCNTFDNPAIALNIPNVDNTIVLYGGSPTPTPSVIRDKKFPWFIYSRRFRNRH